MKRFYIACFILALMIFLSSISLSTTQKYAEDITKRVDELHQLVQNDGEGVEEKLSQLDSTWQKYENKLAMFTEHSELEPIGMSIAALKEYYSVGSFHQFEICCEQILASVEHMKNCPKPTLRNIF